MLGGEHLSVQRQISFAVSDIQTVEILCDKCEHGARLAVVSLAAEAEASRKHSSTIPYAWACSACGEETRDQSSAISLIRTMIQARARLHIRIVIGEPTGDASPPATVK